jgi:hypothetical protein
MDNELRVQLSEDGADVERLDALTSYLRGGRTRRTVRVVLDGDVLELSEASGADQERLIGLFVNRHTTGAGER